MADQQHSAGGSTGNDHPDILASLTRMTELRLAVAEDPVLGVVTVDIAGLPEGCSCILAPSCALDLSLRLTQACGRLMKVRLDQPPPGSAGPFSSTY